MISFPSLATTAWCFTRDGVGVAARGEAIRIEIPGGTSEVAHVRSLLGSIETDDALHRAASGPVAFGALPFIPNEPGHLSIPSVLVAKSSDGTAWVTKTGASG